MSRNLNGSFALATGLHRFHHLPHVFDSVSMLPSRSVSFGVVDGWP